MAALVTARMGRATRRENTRHSRPRQAAMASPTSTVTRASCRAEARPQPGTSRPRAPSGRSGQRYTPPQAPRRRSDTGRGRCPRPGRAGCPRGVGLAAHDQGGPCGPRPPGRWRNPQIGLPGLAQTAGRMIWSMRSSPRCTASTARSLPDPALTGMLTVRMGRRDSGEGYTLCTIGPMRPWV
jgi:hypothetical protein